MITLTDFLTAYNIPLNNENYKIHLAVESSSNPLHAFFQGTFEDWQADQKNKNFECEHVVSFIHLGDKKWLFAGVHKVLSVRANGKRFTYKTELLPNQDAIYGKAIIYYERKSRNSYRWGHTIDEACFLGELLPQRMTVQQYPGHNNVRISYDVLATIIKQNEPSWKGALANIKGIYLITDLSCGKHYVGKADGQDGIWHRWTAYAKNGHGDNVELKKVLNKLGKSHMSNFHFSLLEIADFRTDDDKINERESHWKEILGSRIFGYNGN